VSKIRRHRVVGAPVDEVWAVLADFGAISGWADFVDHSSLMTEQTEGVGTKRRIQIDRTTVVETVTAWEPGATFSYSVTGLPPVIRSVTNTWRIGESGGSTSVSISTQVDTGRRPPQLAIAKAVARRLAKASDAMLAGLAAHLAAKEAR
jgi:hypothetical protein